MFTGCPLLCVGRYGKIQSVKLHRAAGSAASGAVVAFMDITSASKAHNSENTVDGHAVETGYNEPASAGVSTAAGGGVRAGETDGGRTAAAVRPGQLGRAARTDG